MEAVAAGKERTPVRARVLALSAVAVAAVAASLVAWAVTRSSADARPQVSPLVSATGLLERSGVRVTRLVVSGDGGLLDLRYQVVDAGKAQAVHDAAYPPLLVDERSGAVINEVLMGHIHSYAPKAGLTYYLIFVNKGNLVHSGSRVSVRLGDARLAHVLVR
jgi:hypothetical protein